MYSVSKVCFTSSGSRNVSVTLLSSYFSVVMFFFSFSSAPSVFFLLFNSEASFCFPEMCVSLLVSPVLIVLGSSDRRNTYSDVYMLTIMFSYGSLLRVVVN